MDVVADLLAAVAEDRVALARDGALHQVGEEAVKLRAGVVWAGQAAAAKAHRRDLEVAPVLLDHQVGGGLRDAEERMRRAVDRHCRVDPAVPAVPGGELEPLVVLLERQVVGEVAVDLVRRAERERDLGAVVADGLEQVERAERVDAEVGVRVGRRPVV